MFFTPFSGGIVTIFSHTKCQGKIIIEEEEEPEEETNVVVYVLPSIIVLTLILIMIYCFFRWYKQRKDRYKIASVPDAEADSELNSSKLPLK